MATIEHTPSTTDEYEGPPWMVVNDRGQAFAWFDRKEDAERFLAPPDDLRAELVKALRAEVALDEWRKTRNTDQSARALRKALEATGWDGDDFNDVEWWLRDRRAALLARVDARAGAGGEAAK